MARKVDWEGDRRFRLPKAVANPRKKLPQWSVQHVATRSGPVRVMSAAEKALLKYMAPRKRRTAIRKDPPKRKTAAEISSWRAATRAREAKGIAAARAAFEKLPIVEPPK